MDEFSGCPPLHFVSFSSALGSWVERLGGICTCVSIALLGNLLSAILTFIFIVVGSLLGAMTGALIGQKTESGFIRGATIGAISGAVFSLEVYEYSLLLWQTSEPRSTCILYLMEVFASLLSGRLVREQVGPAVQSAVQQQMGGSDASLEDVFDIFDIGGAKGLSRDLVEKIPKIRITTHKQNSSAHDSSEKTSCSVCLQDFELGEMVRCLPNCYHMFHLPCIDKWLTKRGSCPLCRGYI
ncbi:hypothetical protein Sjap_017400 [Stephania japonica]|uniref:RING-type domain-containing protein n=1 Tax=Stephania japonica TaxID=461633 RepID=A0AAP0I638_9MAGN